MNIQYNKLIELGVYHTFFKDGKMKRLVLNPSPETQSLITKYGLSIKAMEHGFTLFSSNSNEVGDILEYLKNNTETESMEFEISSKDPNFYNYTDLPLYSSNQLEYSNDADENLTDNGVLTLKSKSIEKLQTTFFGTIKIYFEALKDHLSKGISEYEIHLDARKTQWNYLVIASTPMIGKLLIEGNSDLKFEEPTEIELMNGDKAQKLSSGSTLLPLQEDFIKLDLVLDSSHHPQGRVKKEVLLPNLPNANPDKIGRLDTDKGKIATSDIYIYI